VFNKKIFLFLQRRLLLFLIFSNISFLNLTACNKHPHFNTSAPPVKKMVQQPQSTVKSQIIPKTFEQTSSTTGTEVAIQPQTSSSKSNKIKYRYNAGEDPEFAKKKGWPKKYPTPLPGSIIPKNRIVAYYGNPLSKRMGVLGEFQKDEMIRRLKDEAEKWEQADPSMPVQTALHLIAAVAQPEPGKSGKYRTIMPEKLINQVYGWAKESGAILFIDIQTGHDNIRTILPEFEWILKNPDVHLGIDPEFNLIESKAKPGKKIGSYNESEINFASSYLKQLIKKYNLPPKILIVHRFTRNGIIDSKKIELSKEVQIVINMDGWGAPWLKRDSYKDYIVAEPVQFTGFKLFYRNDTKKGDPLMTPKELLRLNPKPIYIQYQ